MKRYKAYTDDDLNALMAKGITEYHLAKFLEALKYDLENRQTWHLFFPKVEAESYVYDE